MNVTSTPGGLLLVAVATSASRQTETFIRNGISLDTIYTMIVTIAGLWAVSYISTALAMRGLRHLTRQQHEALS